MVNLSVARARSILCLLRHEKGLLLENDTVFCRPITFILRMTNRTAGGKRMYVRTINTWFFFAYCMDTNNGITSCRGGATSRRAGATSRRAGGTSPTAIHTRVISAGMAAMPNTRNHFLRRVKKRCIEVQLFEVLQYSTPSTTYVPA